MQFGHVLVLLLALSPAAQAVAQTVSEPARPPAQAEPDEQHDDWTRQKCELYALIFKDALGLQGHDGLSPDFLSTNQRFIDAGCTGERSLCPTSEAELAFADLLTLMTMNEGMASTFVPFGCGG